MWVSSFLGPRRKGGRFQFLHRTTVGTDPKDITVLMNLSFTGLPKVKSFIKYSFSYLFTSRRVGNFLNHYTIFGLAGSRYFEGFWKIRRWMIYHIYTFVFFDPTCSSHSPFLHHSFLFLYWLPWSFTSLPSTLTIRNTSYLIPFLLDLCFMVFFGVSVFRWLRRLLLTVPMMVYIS